MVKPLNFNTCLRHFYAYLYYVSCDLLSKPPQIYSLHSRGRSLRSLVAYEASHKFISHDMVAVRANPKQPPTARAPYIYHLCLPIYTNVADLDYWHIELFTPKASSYTIIHTPTNPLLHRLAWPTSPSGRSIPCYHRTCTNPRHRLRFRAH